MLTSRLGLRYPVLSDSADVPRDVGNLAADLDSQVAVDSQGTFGVRPAAGISGRYYYATDQGILYRDNGVSWNTITPVIGEDTIGTFEIAPNSITATELADNSVDAAAIQDNALQNRHFQDAVVGYTEIAAALKPSQGAGAAQESLRALGTGAGMAASGLHAATHQPSGADPYRSPLMTKAAIAALAPVDGQRVIYSPEGTVLWEFQYVSSYGDGYNWVCLNGRSQPMNRVYGGWNNSQGLAGWQNLQTDMAATLPLAAIYDAEFSLHALSITGGADTGTCYFGLSWNGAIDASECYTMQGNISFLGRADDPGELRPYGARVQPSGAVMRFQIYVSLSEATAGDRPAVLYPRFGVWPLRATFA